MNVNEPVTNVELVKQLNLLKKQYSEQTEATVFEELNKAHFLAPVSDTSLSGLAMDDPQNQTIGEGTIEFLPISDADGNIYLPTFTDWDELRKWKKEDGKTLILTLKDYGTILSDDVNLRGVVINPFGQNIVLNSQLIERITERQEESVMVGVPAKYPKVFIKALRRELSKMPMVKKAYLLWMVRNQEEGGYLMVVDVDGRHEEVFQTIGEMAEQYLDDGEIMDFVPLSNAFGQNAVKGQTPFYQK